MGISDEFHDGILYDLEMFITDNSEFFKNRINERNILTSVYYYCHLLQRKLDDRITETTSDEITKYLNKIIHNFNNLLDREHHSDSETPSYKKKNEAGD